MRIHGDVKIIRSHDVPLQTDYKKYNENLREDFHYICGYCGKPESLTAKGFEIDHLVPDNIAPERKLDYTNLVYSCFTCNRKKSGKWPTKDKEKMHNNKIGIIDPVDAEFDTHIYRNKDGNIDGLTPLGKYICKNIFKFHQRPMKELWKCMQIMDKKAQLKNQLANLTQEQVGIYIILDEELENLRTILFTEKE